MGEHYFKVNVVFASVLLIVRQYYSLEELSFCNKLTGSFRGFDLQTVAKCTFLNFDKFFLLLYCTYSQNGLNSHSKNSTY